MSENKNTNTKNEPSIIDKINKFYLGETVDLNFKRPRNRKNWDLDEDTSLDDLAKKFNYNWKLISTFFYKKSASKLEHRWHQRFDNNIKKGKWSPEEDNIIKSKYFEHGPNWKLLSQFLPKRLPRAIKNRFYGKIYKELKTEKCTDNYIDFGSMDIIPTKSIENDNLDIYLGFSEEITSETGSSAEPLKEIDHDQSEKSQILEMLHKKLYDIRENLRIAQNTLFHYQNDEEKTSLLL